MFDSRATKCRCESCCKTDPDPRSTRAFRHECEVRFVLNLPSHAARKDFLAEVYRVRGLAAAQRLRNDAWELMRAAG